MNVRRKIGKEFKRSWRILRRPGRWLGLARWYWTRLLHLPGSARSVAAGTAIGCFVSFTPFLGGRVVLSAGLASLLRVNPMAAIVGSHVGNPLVYPLIFVGAVQLGLWLLGRPGLGPIALERLADLALPAAVGLAVAGSLTSLAVYGVVLSAVRAYQEKHKARRIATRRGREALACSATDGPAL
ncbi:DUF2062 domain-containing protein [Prosthecodimorpha staleyi]|uniref:DUF2062 domain-containing protein n=1 Tax=Prosthecodimorpha staleyi TaxID=2840188 RepID=A0A947D4H2_9HYPH|nr:DUF2062 domain-containing protein [Prosthecodimorpha staleyi]MBT9290064.1 DUF2062 domain-containing protein [Prosthecodimorpha staleyi]